MEEHIKDYAKLPYHTENSPDLTLTPGWKSLCEPFYRRGKVKAVLVELRFRAGTWLQSTPTQEAEQGLRAQGPREGQRDLRGPDEIRAGKHLQDLAIRKSWRTLTSKARNQITGGRE